MKANTGTRQLLILILFFLGLSLTAITPTSPSMMYGYSYMQRARGVHAIYWNPANVGRPVPWSWDLTILDTGFGMRNNAFDIKTYNDISGKYLNEQDKDDILDTLDGKLRVSGEFSMVQAAIAWDRTGLSIGTHARAFTEVTDEYMSLLLKGNEFGQTYVFDKDDNGVGMVAYTDITYTYAKHTLQQYIPYLARTDFPTVYVGFSTSLLIGYAGTSTSSFDGHFLAGTDGIGIRHNVNMQYGAGGFGFKGMVGFSSDVTDNLSMGLTVDNILNFITWKGTIEERSAYVEAEESYLNELDSDVFQQADSTRSIDFYETTFPVEIGLGALYRFSDRFNVSLDWHQAFERSVGTTPDPIIALAGEFFITPHVPVRLSVVPLNGTDPYMVGYSVGYWSRRFEIDFGFGASGAVLPLEKAKGFHFAISSRFMIY